MTDLSYLDAPLELVATSPRLEMLTSRLKTNALRPIAVGETWTRDSRVPLLIDAASVSRFTLERLQRDAEAGMDRVVVLLAPRGAAGVDLHDCLFLHGDDEIATLSARLELRRRRDTRASETTLRRETAERLNGLDEWRARDHTGPGRDILYLGESGQTFQVLKHSFLQKGHDLVAALSAHTAESYLESGRFGLCVLNAGTGQRDVLDLIERMSLGQVFMNVPVVTIADSPAMLRDPANLDVVDDVIHAGEATETIVAGCMTAMARGLPTGAPGRVRLSSKLFDAHTRLYSRAFLDAHLPEQMRVCSRLEAPLSVLSLRINPALAPHDRATQVRLLAKVVTGDVRVTDLAARASATDIAVTLRETPYAGAVKLARRVIDRVHGLGAGVDTPEFSWRVVECRASHTADTLLDGALSGTFMRAVAA